MRFMRQIQIITLVQANQRETITNADRIIHLKMSFKDLSEVLFLSYEENVISEEELYFCMTNSLRRTKNLNLWF